MPPQPLQPLRGASIPPHRLHVVHFAQARQAQAARKLLAQTLSQRRRQIDLSAATGRRVADPAGKAGAAARAA